MTGALRYALRRVLLLLVTMLLVSLLTYLAFELVSGDPARTMLGTEATEAQVQALRHELGLDRPFALRYAHWLGGFFSGDLGVSYSYRQPVWGKEIVDPYTGTTKRVSTNDKNLATNLKSVVNYYLAESFIDSRDRYITNDFYSRIRPVEQNKVKVNAALCPEFELD